MRCLPDKSKSKISPGSPVKSDTVAVIPRYYSGNGCVFYGSTAVVGNELSGVPRERENLIGSTTVVPIKLSLIHI